MWSRWSDGKHIAFSVFFCKNGDCVLYDFSIIFHIVQFFDKTIVKAALLLKKFLEMTSRNIFSVRENFSHFHTTVHSVEITEIYSHSFLAKISWNQRFTKEITEELVWRNINVFKKFSSRECKFRVFPQWLNNYQFILA